jgi:hypothetical protein
LAEAVHPNIASQALQQLYQRQLNSHAISEMKASSAIFDKLCKTMYQKQFGMEDEDNDCLKNFEVEVSEEDELIEALQEKAAAAAAAVQISTLNSLNTMQS